MTDNRLHQIEERNRRVETDKAWETSKTRRALIVAVTYPTIVLVFIAADIPSPLLNALIPVTAYVISTLTFPFLKKYWTYHVYRP